MYVFVKYVRTNMAWASHILALETIYVNQLIRFAGLVSHEE